MAIQLSLEVEDLKNTFQVSLVSDLAPSRLDRPSALGQASVERSGHEKQRPGLVGLDATPACSCLRNLLRHVCLRANYQKPRSTLTKGFI